MGKIDFDQIGKRCVICDKVFPIYDIHDHRMICPECLKRLKELLYPEECNE